MSLKPLIIGVSVQDQGAALPPATLARRTSKQLPAGDLIIVDRLASQWGVIPADPPPGKTVWFQIATSNA